jgi:AbrB family looped-hinge helix DNA binding protein
MHYFLDYGESAMPTLTVTERGQITIRKEVLKHLGIKPGDKIELELLPDGKATMKSARRKGTIDDFINLFADMKLRSLSDEEIKEAIEKGWAGQK